jgi:putative endonuclease
LILTRERLNLGSYGEELALKKIKKLGYKKIIRNYRCPLGEVDLVAKDGDCLVFIEIKTRKGKSVAYAKEAVDARKRRQLSKVALNYMKSNQCNDVKARFDVIAITIDQGETNIEVIQDAFELAY